MPNYGRLRYLEAPSSGRGRPRGTLLLIHAFPLNARMWEAQLSLAENGWRVIAPQLRGMDGGTADPPASSMDDYAGDIVDLLDALHIEDAVIGGLSMGGYVTFALFRLAPRYFRGMVLADTRPQADTPEGAEGRRRMLQTVEQEGVAAIVDDLLPKLLAETTRLTRADVVDRVRALMLAQPAAAVAGALRALMSRQDAAPLLPTIHCPTIVLVGEHDALTPPVLSRDMMRAVAGAELVVVPKAGHLANLEQPAAFNAALAQFLEHRV